MHDAETIDSSFKKLRRFILQGSLGQDFWNFYFVSDRNGISWAHLEIITETGKRVGNGQEKASQDPHGPNTMETTAYIAITCIAREGRFQTECR